MAGLPRRASDEKQATRSNSGGKSTTACKEFIRRAPSSTPQVLTFNVIDPDTSSTEAAGDRYVTELASVRLPPLPKPYRSVRDLADKMENALLEHLAID